MNKSHKMMPNQLVMPPTVSRKVVRDDQTIVVVVKSPAQVLPYTILDVRRELFTKAGGAATGTGTATPPAAS